MLQIAKLRAKRQIDQMAGETRLLFITDVPGQQAVYMTKVEQARQYLTDLENAEIEGPETGVPFVGPYINVEATVLGVTPEAAAQDILATAELWNDEIGPAIELIRRQNKIYIDLCTTEEQVAEALVAAEAAFMAVANT